MQGARDTGSAQSAAETAYRRLKHDLVAAARRWRRRDDVSPGEIASRLDCCPTMLGRLEIDGSETSLDLVVRYLLVLGATRRDIALEIVRRE